MEGYSKYQISKFIGTNRDYQIVIRTDDADELLEAMKKIKPLIEGIETSVKPAPSSFTPSSSDPNLFCIYHKTGMKLNKNGKPYHMDRNRDEGDQFCNGRGFPQEFEAWKERKNQDQAVDVNGAVPF